MGHPIAVKPAILVADPQYDTRFLTHQPIDRRLAPKVQLLFQKQRPTNALDDEWHVATHAIVFFLNGTKAFLVPLFDKRMTNASMANVLHTRQAVPTLRDACVTVCMCKMMLHLNAPEQGWA